MTDRPAQPRSAEPSGKPRSRLIVAGGLGLVAGAAIAGAVYGIAAFKRNVADAGDPACKPAVELAKRLAPLIHGEVAGLVAAEKPLRLPNLALNDAAGARRHLADWRGRTVLFNLWATWCLPCRKEMPALDALQAKLGGAAFEVVAVNIDTRDLDKPKNWLKEVGISRLAYYADPSAKVFQDLKVVGRATGMPTTLLVDPAGCEVATLFGPAEWASDDAIRVVSAALAK
jgi:thiol-disulfide isomerase/thioredoxin